MRNIKDFVQMIALGGLRIKDILDRANILRMVFGIQFALVWGIVLLLAYWSFRPYEVYEFNGPYEVLNKEVRPGEKVLVRQVYCKKMAVPVTVGISIVDGYSELLRIFTSNKEIGCYDGVSSTVIVPETSIPGEYKVRFTLEAKVNPIRSVVYVQETETFNVLPAEE